MPDTRGRTSDTRVGAMRPGNSRMIARACGLTVTTLTSSSEACTAAVAGFGSSHPANRGAIARSISAMHADCARNRDIEKLAPGSELKREYSFAHDAAMTPRWLIDGARIRSPCCDAIRARGGAMSHDAITLNRRQVLPTQRIVSGRDPPTRGNGIQGAANRTGFISVRDEAARRKIVG